MRNQNEIQDRIRYLLTIELDKQVHKGCSRLPDNCKHHLCQPLPDNRKKIAGEVNVNYNRINVDLPWAGLCMLGSDNPEEWGGTICEDPVDAQRCESFTLAVTKEQVSGKFNSQIGDLNWVEQNLPEVYGLLWALGSEKVPTLPWWKSLWFWFLRIRPDPIILNKDE